MGCFFHCYLVQLTLPVMYVFSLTALSLNAYPPAPARCNTALPYLDFLIDIQCSKPSFERIPLIYSIGHIRDGLILLSLDIILTFLGAGV